MSTSLVERTNGKGTVTLTLNRPEKLNALTLAVFEELRAHIDAVRLDKDVACVMLTGAGRSFCAGHDLDPNVADHGKSDTFAAETIDALEALPMPTVAKIRGHCFTGGLELALGCDLLVCATSAILGDTHGQWGLAPIWGMSVRLPERIGRSRAKELMFTSRRIDGTTAAAIGLVNGCVEEDDLDSSADDLVAEIVANSGGTNRIDKALFAANREMTRADALRFERTRPFGLPADTRERMRRAPVSRRAREG